MRNKELDGIRGGASLMVLFFHVFWEFFGAYNNEFRSPYVKILISGPLAVCLFFVLSGESLALILDNKGKVGLDRVVVKRYFRLSVPIFMSCFFVYLAMKFGMIYSKEAASILNNNWLSNFLKQDPSLFGLIKYSFSDVFVSHTSFNSYNPFLWPMSIELIGSYIVFLYLYAQGSFIFKGKYLAGGLFISFLVHPFYGLFVFGLLLAEMKKSNWYIKLIAWPAVGKISGFAIALIYIISVFYFKGRSQVGGVGGEISGGNNDVVYSLLAMVVLFLFNFNKLALGFFSSKIMVFFGQISFSLYLNHFLIIATIGSYMVSRCSVSDLGRTEIITISLVIIVFSILFAYIFSLLEKWIVVNIDTKINKSVGCAR